MMCRFIKPGVFLFQKCPVYMEIPVKEWDGSAKQVNEGAGYLGKSEREAVISMNIGMHDFGSSVFGRGLLPMGRGLKSTQQKRERQETRDRQVAFFENQKENLKNVKCGTVEEIARKLELFRSYEDQIAAAKAAYNNEQMWHMMDESREISEKIAEAVEKSKPKTPEERMEDFAKEAAGTESGGILEELDEALEEALDLQREMWDVQQEMTQENLQNGTVLDLQEAAAGKASMQETAGQTGEAATLEETQQLKWEAGPAMMQQTAEELAAEKLRRAEILYRPFDIKV